MIRFWLPVLVGFAIFSSTGQADVEYLCGTLPLAGAFWADAGSFSCKDPSGKSAKIDVAETTGTKPVICMFSAGCTPATKATKEAVLKATGQSDWSKLDDEKINQALIKEFANAPRGPIELVPMSAQCVGQKIVTVASGSVKEREQIRCPSVNDCVNQKNSSIQWKVKPLSNMNPTLIDASDSEGFRMENPQGAAPRGVVK